MIHLKINQKSVEVEEGTTLLAAADKVGINIPTLCSHKALSPYGACRICMVEIVEGGRPGLVASCQYRASDGLVIQTDSEKVHKTRRTMLELALAKSPDAEDVQKLAKEYGVGEPRFQRKKHDDCILCGLCVRMCQERMGQTVIGFVGRGNERTVGPAFDRTSPVCMGCGACSFVCPTNAISEKELCKNEIVPQLSPFEGGVSTKPAINILYPQAVPKVPVIDTEQCVHMNNGTCKICQTVCEAEAIDYEMEEQKRVIDVGAVILNPGFDLFDPTLKGEYGYGVYPNVITSRQFERILSASGPTQGEVVRPSDGTHPKKIAFISCVGSRDTACGNEYCSSVCCMYSTKEAVIAKEHDANIEPTIFYMDMRSFGKNFDRYINNAKDQHGVRYIRCMASKVVELQQSKNLKIRYSLEDGSSLMEEFEMVVLATGITPSDESKALAQRLGLELNEYGFCKKVGFSPTETSKRGIFVSGAFGEPKDIPETVIEASSAAAEASALLASARGTLAVEKAYPEEKAVAAVEPRVGVFVCRCGRNIGAFVDVPAVTEYARGLPNVVFADENLYTCAKDSLEVIKDEIEKHDLTRVVVASCTPTTHGPLFRDTVREAGLNPYLFEMASIREHVSWVHMDEPEKATEKAKQVVAMSVSKAALLSPIHQGFFDLNKEGMVIGGGIAGMTAALSLAEQGFGVHLVEREDRLGGHMNEMYETIDGRDVQTFMKKTIDAVEAHENIRTYVNSEIKELSGYLGNYTSTVKSNGSDEPVEVNHGVVIVATGANATPATEYEYGNHDSIITQRQLEEKLSNDEKEGLDKVVMIQCVGSRNEERPYCSRVCCSEAIKNALKIKESNPEADITILYRDIRTYGFREKYYLKARQQGIVFLRYEEEEKPVVSQNNGKLEVKILDRIIGEEVTLTPATLVLSTGMEGDNHTMAQTLKVPLNEDGFFMEAHAKIRPLDFTAEGMFLCGLAHSPRTIEEAVAQAKGAAIRAATILSKDKIMAKPEIPEVSEKWCAGCEFCVRACPYDARRLNPDTRVAEVVEVLCQACGACTVACPSGVCQQKGFHKDEVMVMIDTGMEK